jgi:hypothetical protein
MLTLNSLESWDIAQSKKLQEESLEKSLPKQLSLQND